MADTPTKYRLLKDRFEHKAGVTVYECWKYDYGLCRDDYNVTGLDHVAVTLKPDGDYPFFTVPVRDLETVMADTPEERAYQHLKKWHALSWTDDEANALALLLRTSRREGAMQMRWRVIAMYQKRLSELEANNGPIATIEFYKQRIEDVRALDLFGK